MCELVTTPPRDVLVLCFDSHSVEASGDAAVDEHAVELANELSYGARLRVQLERYTAG